MNFQTLFLIVAVLLLFCCIFALIRIFIGPTIPNRMVGLDTLNTLIVSIMIVLAAAFGREIYISVAIVYTLLSFIGTLYISKYVEGDLN